jgi:poly(A) polymerase
MPNLGLDSRISAPGALAFASDARLCYQPEPPMTPQPIALSTDSAVTLEAVPESAGAPGLVRQALTYALLTARQAGATPDLPVWRGGRVSSADLRSLPTDELRAALDDILLARKADQGLSVLLDAGILDALFPEVTALVGFGEGEAYHKDVWRHTIRVVIQSVPRLAVRWAALFHDIGKPATRSMSADGTVHFLHHAEVGARMFEKIARRERLFPDRELREQIRFLIYYHQRAHQYEASWTDSATRRFAREVGPHLSDLMALSRADMTTRRKEKRRRFMVQLKILSDRIERLNQEDSKPKALPKGLGEAIIAEFSLPPSKLVGDIRKALEAAVESGELPGQAEFATYLDFVRAHAARFNLPT